MDITLNELLKGKATVIKGKEYFSTERFVKPFLDKIDNIATDIKIKAKLPDQLTLNSLNSDIDLTFNRVLIQAKLNSKIDDLDETISMCYALDSKKPCCKIYRSYTDEDGSMFVFDPLFIAKNQIEPGDALIYNIKSLLELTNNTEVNIEKLKNTTIEFNDDIINKLFGKWQRRCMNFEFNDEYGPVKISNTLCNNVYKSLFEDRGGKFYLNENIDLYTVYNAFSYFINSDEKDLYNRFEKSILINNIL